MKICWVLLSFESSNEYTQQTIILQIGKKKKKKTQNIPQLYPFAFWPASIIKPQSLELPMSRTNFHGPRVVQATEVWK